MENNQQQAKPITLSVEHLKTLESYISDLPTKYGVPLLNFLSQIAQEQATPVEAAETI